mgnify:FL=1
MLFRSGCSSSQNWPTADAEVTTRSNRSLSDGAAVRPALAALVQAWLTARAEDSEQTGGHRGAADTLTSATSNWATPNAHEGTRHLDNHSTQGANLLRDVSQWQTPATDSFRSRDGDRKDEQGLDQQARFFPTPAARDGKGANGEEHLENGTGRKHLDQLPNFISHSFRLDPETPTDGGACSKSRPKLNPLFVEWLMGWPLHWTDCGAVATASWASWRQRHSLALRQILRQGACCESGAA